MSHHVFRLSLWERPHEVRVRATSTNKKRREEKRREESTWICRIHRMKDK